MTETCDFAANTFGEEIEFTIKVRGSMAASNAYEDVSDLLAEQGFTTELVVSADRGPVVVHDMTGKPQHLHDGVTFHVSFTGYCPGCE